MKQSIRYSLVFLFAICIAPGIMWGQAAGSGYGTITGRITDPSGAAVPDATVTIRDVSTNATRTAMTNGSGLYVFSDVKPATYNLTLTKSGFQKAIVNGQTVIVGLSVNVNVTMKVGSTTQTVQVTATPGAELQTLNSTMGTSLSGNTIIQLPTFSRDATSLLYFQPTAVPDFNGSTGDITSGTVAGQTSDQNTYSIDGGNATDDLSGDNGYVNNYMAGIAAIPTPVESIQEFDVTTTNATSDFSDSTGGHVLLVTKRGTDAFHGAVYDYFQNSALDTDDWSNNFTGQAKPFSTYNRFGFDFGGPLLPKIAGGKTYFYFNYEGFRWPESEIYERDVPSTLMRQGILQFRDANGNVVQYNLNTSAQCGPSGGVKCDPLGIGMNPDIAKMWSQYEPLPNDFNAGDHLNTFGYQAPLALPQSQNFLVGRVDHDFSSKLHWFSSYRWYDNTNPTDDQVDIGGLLSGDTLGAPKSISSNLNSPRYFVTGLTASLTPNMTNDFHFSFLRNDWNWGRGGFIPQVSGVTAPLELGEQTTGEPTGGNDDNSLIPVNVNTQSARQRLWDSHDADFRDTLSWLKGNHYLQFGGEFMRDWWHFNRYDDVVAGLANTVVDQIGYGGGEIFMPTSAQPIPCSATLTANCLPSSELSSWNALYADTLGLVDQTQTLVSRSGNNLNLNPIGTPLASYMIDDYYNLFAGDAWKVRPSITLSLGLSYGYMTPPYSINGAQDVLTDSAGGILTVPTYLNSRLTAAENGGTYAPIIGYAPVGDVNGGLKYPYQPFYGGFQPRVAVAWSPNASGGFLNKILGNQATVIRGGYSRLYDRSEAIATVTNSVLGDGFLQPVGCTAPSITSACLGTGGTTPSTAFRIGINGGAAPLPSIPQTLSIPVEPGVNSSYISALSAGLNYDLPPGYSDQFDFTIQRQFPGNVLVEVGWVGNWDHNLYQGVDLNDVPWMMKLNGQTFANAYDNLYSDLAHSKPVTAQPFFESALGGPNSSYCKGFGSCSAAVAANESGNISTNSVTSLWSDLDNSFTFGPQLLSTTQCYWCYFQTSDGYGNYNALTATVQKRTGNGLTLSSSFTYGHALGTIGLEQTYTLDGLDDPWDPGVDYGPQYFDHKFIDSTVASYNLPIGPGHRFLATSNPILKRVLGGWTVAPIFSIESGQPLDVYTSANDQDFGAGYDENSVAAVPLINTASLSNSPHFGVTEPGLVGSNSNPVNGGPGVNMFGANAQQVYNGFAPCLVGMCNRAGGAGQLRAPSLWDLDFSINKTTQITERVSVEFFSEWFNALNHMAWGGDLMSENLQDPADFGTLGQFNVLQSNYTRIIQLGLRLSF
ncbi:MAG TPA: carboxypeptidase-like regulatory domain-containing protein [Terriglobia bacterium]|nr:carboxypeptidase-like regulatory domain-containing protein [Terriglobia bacterium]